MQDQWKKQAWWVEEHEDKEQLSFRQLAIKSRLPSYLVKDNIKSKTRLLSKIKPLLQQLPIQLFYRILLFLNLECALFLQAMGLEDKVLACLRTYPENLCRAWKNFNRTLEGPTLSTECVTPATLSRITCFNKFFASISESPLYTNSLFSKIQIDAIKSTHSAFNPCYPLIGMCLNNDFTYYVFATDSSVYREETTAFTHNSHVKYIFDFPNSQIEGVSWSPNGEILAVITKLTALTPTECALKLGLFPVKITLAHYLPSSGVIREFVGIGQEIITACSRFITPNLWIDDTTLLTVESSGKKFRKLVINTGLNEFTEYHQNTTGGLLAFVNGMECSNFKRQKNYVGSMSVSKFYPKNVAAFVVTCAAHSGTSHSTILFYDFVKDVAVKRIDLAGFLRSTYICPQKTILYVEKNELAEYNVRRDGAHERDSLKFCSKEGWIKKLGYISGGSLRICGDVYGIFHDCLSLHNYTDETLINLEHNSDNEYIRKLHATTPSEIYASLYSTGLDRSLQACETYAFICTEMNNSTETLARVTFTCQSAYPVRTVYVPGRKKQGCVSISQCGFLTFAEYSGFWKKPQIYYSPYMPSRNCPLNNNYYTKLYYEKPKLIYKNYARYDGEK
jgi:hypothetical protein